MSDGRPDTDRLAPRNLALSDEAIDWIVRLGSEAATDADRSAFEAWLARSPAHAEAAAEAVSIMEDIGETRTADEYREVGAAIRHPVSAPLRFSRRRVLAGGIAAVAAGLSASGMLGPPSALWSDHATGIGGRKRIDLPDGSVAWLNTASALSVDYTNARRRLTLHAGEALFQVEKDKARPFVVRSGEGEARALGTVCSVRHGTINDVVVTEGVVEVRAGSRSARLIAGQRVAYGDDILGAVEAVDANAATAWSRGKLIFNRRPLGEVAAELERYQYGKVIVRGESLRRLEVTGVFDLDDMAALFRAVAGTVNVPVTRLPLLTIIG
ncbi:MAG: FecR domain-containing protein [Sphingomonas bacterium]